jgi:vancomycin resistance protein YoaR
MSTYSATHTPSVWPYVLRFFLAVTSGLVLFVLLLAGFVIGYDMYYAGMIYPGVSVAGQDLSGLTPPQAAAKLTVALRYTEEGKIAFMEGSQVWVAKPAELGLYLDPQNSAMAAFGVGRKGGMLARYRSQFDAWNYGLDLPPLLVYDERAARAYFQQIEAEINLPTVEATLDIRGTEVVAQPGQIGRRVDIEATLAPLANQMRSLSDGILPVVMVETPPEILDVSQQAEVARTILSSPLTVFVPDAQEGDPGPWVFQPDQLAEMITIARVDGDTGAEYHVRLDAESMRSFLNEAAPRLVRYPSNSKFVFNDDSRQLEVIQPAVIGRSLNVDATIQAINEGLPQGQHDIGLVLNHTPPAVTDDMTGEQLGITELVASNTTYFYGSSSGRIQNIKTAASRFHGVMVPPGAVFSMAETLGDVSLDNGYAEALIIFNNRTIQGVGGGVCQVSTTLFRTVFFGGFPVVERYPHAYRVTYYEMTASRGYDTKLAGLDATVYVPVVDFKFKNDTPYWLLMETYVVNNSSLVWKFYSTSDGRQVTWETTGLQNIVEPPPPLYEENANLASGTIKQVDWEVRGADVTVYRRVTRSGELYFNDRFTTHYLPWRSIYQYGPGTELPSGN